MAEAGCSNRPRLAILEKSTERVFSSSTSLLSAVLDALALSLSPLVPSFLHNRDVFAMLRELLLFFLLRLSRFVASRLRKLRKSIPSVYPRKSCFF